MAGHLPSILGIPAGTAPGMLMYLIPGIIAHGTTAGTRPTISVYGIRLIGDGLITPGGVTAIGGLATVGAGMATVGAGMADTTTIMPVVEYIVLLRVVPRALGAPDIVLD